MKIKISNANTPTWKDVTVKSRIPEELKKLEELARNIWWAWNYEAIELFRDLDQRLKISLCTSHIAGEYGRLARYEICKTFCYFKSTFYIIRTFT